MKPKPFIPAWLNLAGLSQAEFRVYCCLAARADIKTGIAWPKAETIGTDCLMARNTVWKSLRSLEGKKFIRRVGKPFQGSSRYQVLIPIGANEIPIEEPSIGANEIPIEDCPIGANETPPIGANEILQSAQMDSREGITNKSNQRRVTTRENSPEEIQFAIWFKSSLPIEEQERMPKNWLSNFCDTFEKLVRIDKRTPEQIREVSRWGRTDHFWQANFKSPLKLRKRDKNGTLYFDVIAGRMKQPANQTSKPITNTDLGGRASQQTETEKAQFNV